VTCIILVFQQQVFRPTGGVIKATMENFMEQPSWGNKWKRNCIFRNTDGKQLYVLHQFNNSEGYEPSGKLLEASDGKLYGACDGVFPIQEFSIGSIKTDLVLK
jgi:hypothetical protein